MAHGGEQEEVTDQWQCGSDPELCHGDFGGHLPQQTGGGIHAHPADAHLHDVAGVTDLTALVKTLAVSSSVAVQ